MLFVQIIIVTSTLIVSTQLPNFTNPTNFSVKSVSPLNGKNSYIMISTSDGGALCSGNIDSNNAIITKLSSTGIIEWKTILNKDSSIDITTISEVEGSKYLACGYIYGSGNYQFQIDAILYAALLDNNGTIQWRMPIATPSNRKYFSDFNPLIKCTNEKYALLTTKIFNGQTYKILPALRFYNPNGLLIKETLYDSLHSSMFYVHPFFQTKDNGFVGLVHGEIGVTTFEQLWRLDSNGGILWKKEFTDVSYSTFSYYSSMIELSDGGFFVATTALVNSPDTTFIILRRFDNNGNEIIKKKYGIRRLNAITQMQQTPNQDVVMIGYSHNGSQYSGSDICLFRVGPTGKLRWQETFGDSTTGDYGNSISVVDDHTFYIGCGTGKTEDPYTGTRPVVFKISDLVSAVSEQPEPSDGITISPNPSSTSFTISGIEGVTSVKILTVLGIEVGAWGEGRGARMFDVSDLASGVYFVQFRTQTGVISKPIVVSR